MSIIEEKNKPKNKRQAFLRLIEYLRPYKRSVAIGVMSNLWVGLIALIPPLVYGGITDRVVINKAGAPDAARFHLLWVSITVQMLVYGSSSFMIWVRTQTMHILGERILLDLRKHIYTRMQ